MATKSPVLKNKVKAEQMYKFFEALGKVMEGKKVHKVEWEDREYYGHLLNGVLTLHKPDGKDYNWILSDGDMNGEDWVVL
jgi:hypothetical protein